MTVAVTGASGHVGGNLVRALLAQGREVRVLARQDHRAFAGLEVEIVDGDLFDEDSLARLLDGAETVFHLAARISIVGPEGGLVERTNVLGARNVAAACLAAGVKRLVHASSIHAFSTHPNSEVIDETRALALDRRHLAYDRSKARGTLEVLAAVERGLDAVIVHPSGVIGPNDFKVSRMGAVILDLVHRRLPALIDGGYNWVDVRDVVDGMLAAEKNGRRGERYLLTGRWAHVVELAALVTKFTGRPTPRFRTPLWLAMPASYGSLLWGRVTRTTPKFTPGAVRAVAMHRYVSHLKATEELGYNPRPLEATIRDTLAWFAEAGMIEA
ncbi:MAG: SDR family oxidoreductase [Proteobacteria bacterium]|jgi:dihydroflavonol-4-reductase|nr:SDR family oxidoreductase [Pseudomonadota bacterium]